MNKWLVPLFCLSLLGCDSNPKKDSVTLVPITKPVEFQMPEKPQLASSSLNKESSQDDTLKAALKDLESLRSYSEQMEKILITK